MFSTASLRRRPAVEALEPRLTPAEVGANDFRLSDMGPNGNPNFDGVIPAAAYNPSNNQYLVVWFGDDTTDQELEIFGQRINAATGAPVGVNDFRLSDMGPDGNPSFEARNPAVAYNSVNNEYLVVWEGDDDIAPLVDNEKEIFGQRINAATGVQIGPDFRLSDMGTNGNVNFEAHNPAVAYDSVNNEYLVVWSGDDDTGLLVDGEFEIFGQRLTGTGAEIGPDFRLSDMGSDGNTNFKARAAAVVYNPTSNEYLVVWEGDDNTAPLVDNEKEIFGQRLNAATGLPVGANDFRLSRIGPDGDANFEARDPALAYNPGNNQYLVVWTGDNATDNEFEIHGQRLDATGGLLGTNFRLSDMGPDADPAFGIPGFGVGFARVAYNGTDSEYLVVWNGDDDTAPLVDDEMEVFGQRLNAATGTEIGANDFRLSDMGPDGDPAFLGVAPAVAYNGTNNEYLVVWTGNDDTGSLVDPEFEIFGQRFSAADPLPPAPPPPAPPPPLQIVAGQFRRNGVAKVRVKDAATGAVRAVLTPFKGFTGKLRLQLGDVNGDGSLDLIVKAVIRGRRKKKVFDAVTLALL